MFHKQLAKVICIHSHTCITYFDPFLEKLSFFVRSSFVHITLLNLIVVSTMAAEPRLSRTVQWMLYEVLNAILAHLESFLTAKIK